MAEHFNVNDFIIQSRQTGFWNYQSLTIAQLEELIARLRADFAQLGQFFQATAKRLFNEQTAANRFGTDNAQIIINLQNTLDNKQAIIASRQAEIDGALRALSEKLATAAVITDNDNTLVSPNLDAVVNEQESNLISETTETTSQSQEEIIDQILIQQNQEFEQTGIITTQEFPELPLEQPPAQPQGQGGGIGLLALLFLASGGL